MKAISRVMDILAAIATWLAVGCIGILAAILLLPRLFGAQPYIVLSGSMEPMIHTGSLVYVSELDHEPEVGDVIAYAAADGMAVIHRVDSINHNGYVMKGDANDVQDAREVRIENVIGQYKFSVPKLGYALSFIEGHQFRLGPVSVPAMVPVIVGAVLLLRFLAYMLGVLAEDEDDMAEG